MKLYLRRALNLLLWLNVCFLGGTGVVLFWRLPHGQGSHGLTLAGMTRHEWGAWHAYAGVLFAILVIAHLVLAWPWLKNAAAGKKRLWAVVAGLTLGAAIPLAFALYPLEGEPTGRGHGEHRGWSAKHGEHGDP